MAEKLEGREGGGSGQQGRESSGVKVPMPSVARFGRLAYPLLGEVTNRDMRGSRSHGCPEGCRDFGKDKGSRTEGQSESDGITTEPYRTSREPGNTDSLR